MCWWVSTKSQMHSKIFFIWFKFVSCANGGKTKKKKEEEEKKKRSWEGKGNVTCEEKLGTSREGERIQIS